MASSYPNLDSGHFSYKLGDTNVGNTISNLIDDFGIDLNGRLNDWISVTSFGRDENDIADATVQADWLETWSVHDSNNLYFVYENDGNLSPITWP